MSNNDLMIRPVLLLLFCSCRILRVLVAVQVEELSGPHFHSAASFKTKQFATARSLCTQREPSCLIKLTLEFLVNNNGTMRQSWMFLGACPFAYYPVRQKMCLCVRFILSELPSRLISVSPFSVRTTRGRTFDSSSG